MVEPESIIVGVQYSKQLTSILFNSKIILCNN